MMMTLRYVIAGHVRSSSCRYRVSERAMYHSPFGQACALVVISTTAGCVLHRDAAGGIRRKSFEILNQARW